MMQYALFARPVVTIYDLPQTTKQSEAGLVSTIGDEGLYGQACQVRTAPGGVTAEGVPLSPEVARGGHLLRLPRLCPAGCTEICQRGCAAGLSAPAAGAGGRATDVLSLPKVQGVRMLELERGCLLCRLPEPPEEALAHTGWAKVALLDGRTGYVRDVALEPVRFEMTAVFSQREGLAFDDALAEAGILPPGSWCRRHCRRGTTAARKRSGMPSARRRKSIWAPSTAGAANRAGALIVPALSAVPICSAACSSTGCQDRGGLAHAPDPLCRQKAGRCLYFPGHIALYLGEGRYIHSTGASASGGVVINSLDPADPLYREDLVKSLYAVGSVF